MVRARYRPPLSTIRVNNWAISSVGRAPPLQGGGQWFEPAIAHQLFIRNVICLMKWAISSVGRAPPLQGGGQWFEPAIAHHFISCSH